MVKGGKFCGVKVMIVRIVMSTAWTHELEKSLGGSNRRSNHRISNMSYDNKVSVGGTKIATLGSPFGVLSPNIFSCSTEGVSAR